MTVQPITVQLPTEELLVKRDMIYHQHMSSFAQRTEQDGTSRIINITRNSIELVNTSIAEMYLVALSSYKGNFIPYNRLHLLDLSASTTDLVMAPMASLASWNEEFQHSWRQKKSFIYTLNISTLHQEIKFSILLEDLNRFFGNMFGLQGKIISRVINCHCLVHDGQTPIKNVSNKSFIHATAGSITIQNKTLFNLVQYLDAQHVFSPGLPVVDKTFISTPVTLSLNADMHDLKEVNSGLKEYGLSLQQQYTRINILQLSKIKQKSTQEKQKSPQDKKS